MLDVGLTVLELQKEGNLWGWFPYHVTWGKVELTSSRNIFSSVAMSARTVEIIVRRQTVTLDNAVLWGDKLLFITAIDDTDDRHRIKITTAVIRPVDCYVVRDVMERNELNRLEKTDSATLAFPAFQTEKYLGNVASDPQVILTTQYVLIVPKVIVLKEGETVTVDGKKYTVLIAHELDDHKNEYEIERVTEA